MTNDRLVRDKEVLEILPISRASWWSGVRSGRYPQPVRLGERTTCWKLSEIMAVVENGVNKEVA